jgi:hypothetical protein
MKLSRRFEDSKRNHGLKSSVAIDGSQSTKGIKKRHRRLTTGLMPSSNRICIKKTFIIAVMSTVIV